MSRLNLNVQFKLSAHIEAKTKPIKSVIRAAPFFVLSPRTVQAGVLFSQGCGLLVRFRGLVLLCCSGGCGAVLCCGIGGGGVGVPLSVPLAAVLLAWCLGAVLLLCCGAAVLYCVACGAAAVASLGLVVSPLATGSAVVGCERFLFGDSRSMLVLFLVVWQVFNQITRLTVERSTKSVQYPNVEPLKLTTASEF